MPTREELHKLIDSMPEGAMEAAHRALSHLQVWPPPPPPDMAEMRRRLEERHLEMRKRIESRERRPGTVSGFGGGGSYDPARGSGSSGMSRWDDDTFVV